jgi:hypothetical protein
VATFTPDRLIIVDERLRNANFTRPQDPPSPTNLTRSSKRRHTNFNVAVPPRLDSGNRASTTNPASRAIRSHLDALEREAKLQRKIMHSFADTVDHFVTQWKAPDECKLALDICGKIVDYISTSTYADSSNIIIIIITEYEKEYSDLKRRGTFKSCREWDGLMRNSCRSPFSGTISLFNGTAPWPSKQLFKRWTQQKAVSTTRRCS